MRVRKLARLCGVSPDVLVRVVPVDVDQHRTDAPDSPIAVVGVVDAIGFGEIRPVEAGRVDASPRRSKPRHGSLVLIGRAAGPDDLSIRPTARQDAPDLVQRPSVIGHRVAPLRVRRTRRPLIRGPPTWRG